jgi:hypothetical protein
MTTIIQKNWFNINKFIDDNNLEKGIVLINEKKNKDNRLLNLRQIKFIKEDSSFIKKVDNINEIQDYLFHSSNEISINLVDNNLIHVYFKKINPNILDFFILNDIHNDSIFLTLNYDIYNINCCDILNIKKSLSINYTVKNIKENNISIKQIKNILDFILKNEELTDLIHISYDDFIKKLKNFN